MDRRLQALAKARVLVVGDLILDRYWSGATSRISPEAPVPVVLVEDVEQRVGGAANVAANIAAVGGKATLVGVVGADADGEALAGLCRDVGVEPAFLTSQTCATTVKLRVVSQRQQLVRLDFEAMPSDCLSDVAAAAAERLDECDVVVVSDYAKGAAMGAADIIAAAHGAGKAVVVDPKGTDFSRYAGASVVTPNLKEFEAVAGDCRDESELVTRAERLLSEFDLGALLVTRGAQGMSLVERGGRVEHMRAEAHEVFDVTGAGDTVCGLVAAALAAGCSLADAATLANTAAGLVVGRFGAATVGPAEIDAALVTQAGVRRGVLSPAELGEECRKARRRGERIVMTNGCFDILHAGHVRYLAAARELGQRLVVAVNDDASVAGLKGADRPVNDLASRMQVLAALGAVDWVVPFAEETPRDLIASVLPDVLVKGGDYQPGEIAGGAEVEAAGGRVVVLDYHEGYSTSSVIEQIAGSRGSE
ncbi:MAG: bifunctional D-glycero-beta-D-manno-heptose-7-phosphate kinase/D-glycero-beta-D-manno-heptose 1-phosphate adenylyltransferase HldE [Gammaproteobacteria bacterium]